MTKHLHGVSGSQVGKHAGGQTAHGPSLSLCFPEAAVQVTQQGVWKDPAAGGEGGRRSPSCIGTLLGVQASAGVCCLDLMLHQQRPVEALVEYCGRLASGSC